MEEGRTYGYVRVSSKEQNEDRQVIALGEAGVAAERMYIDKQSGKDFARTAYHRLIRRLHKGDVLVVKSIDRLGRNYDEIVLQWRILTKDKNVDIVILDMPLLDTRQKDVGLIGTFIADIVLQILSYVAQAERESIRQRQAEGIMAAHARGVRFGRPVIKLPENFAQMAKEWERSELRTKDFMRQAGMSEATLYRRLREHQVVRAK